MNKTELVASVATKTGLTKKDAKLALDAVLDTITEVLVKKEQISFVGFGTFTTTVKAARTCKVPGTTRTVDLPETVAVKFKVGKELKTKVSGK